MVYRKILLLCFVLVSFFCDAQPIHKNEKNLLNTIDAKFNDAAIQYKYLEKLVTPGQFPRSFDAKTNKIITSGSEWWCSGFYPGALLYIYEQTSDQRILDEVKRVLNDLKKEQFNKTTHDLGFMMYCSFGNAVRMLPDPEYNEILINSAKSLASRFNPNVGCIKSWDTGTANDFYVIIDNMMNLELLFWATKFTGDSTFYNIAVSHANTTLRNQFRKDNSSYHVVNYNSNTGQVIKKITNQGQSDESAWARGQAWGLYGFLLMYRETRNNLYLQQAEKIADFIKNHPRLPKDKVPFWDFDAPNIPNAFRDASSAAIIAAALLELSQYTEDRNNKKSHFELAATIINSLTSAKYWATNKTNGGFLVKHNVGNMPANSEIDSPLSYADYYLLEAMKRYKDLSSGKN